MSIFFPFQCDCSLNYPTKCLVTSSVSINGDGCRARLTRAYYGSGTPASPALPVSALAAVELEEDVPKKTEGGFHTPLHVCNSGSCSDAPSQPRGGQIRERLPLTIASLKEKSHIEVRRNPSSVSFGLIKNSSPYTAMRVKWG